MVALCCLFAQPGQAQRMCGQGYLFNKLNAENPVRMQQMREQHEKLIADALANPEAKAKATALSPIPVVFHFVLTTPQYYLLGGDSGIKRRVNSQIAVLNRDYTGTNTDKNLVPSGFLGRFGNAGVTFGLANAGSAYTIAAGVEVKLVSNTARYDVNNSCSFVKHDSLGLPAWDVKKFLNVWITNIWGGSVSNLILGVTVSPSSVYQWSAYPENELGVVLNYGAMGSREFSSQYFYDNIDKGRTLTHEFGHYFELWHIWGDDGGLCPSNGGRDDGITDTPPQADATYCNSGVCPTYPKYDACSPSGDGIMFMNYMDYVDDAAMYMFTAGQVGVMRSQFAVATGPSYSLTQNPGLSKLAVEDVKSSPIAECSLSPNPSNGLVHLMLEKAEGFLGAQVLNMTGQTLAAIAPRAGIKEYDINLSDAPKGFYLVQCRYEGGTVTKKLVLE